ncbi:hypothetical protein [Hymenobacter armeniacus]|uniref:Lipoprotein n=1 Tax=Hymenobacter armeniacus TaxID=2771358 RepID=A0ABR8JWA0_9BACT|nr:hypothetical protein [Hymenobacter armeniacus]MBD2723076.1 hypothetical protein [Hymenobacter armeniacus]
MLRKFLLYLCLATLTQCSKCKNDPTPDPPKDPLTLLPPETKTGARTFGCLVNGKAYVAPFTTSANGDWQSTTKLAIGSTTRLNGEAGGEMSTILIALNGALQSNQTFAIISSATPFPIFTPGVNQFYSHVAALPCVYDGDYFTTGKVELVKFDPVARIAAGRFAFTLYKPGCDSVRVTNGRFDVKF